MVEEDYALALQLESQFFDENQKDYLDTMSLIHEPKSLVDSYWELSDPNPDIRALFLQFNDRFFGGQLAGIEVKWSPRMTLCAGLCCYEGKGGLCSVRLSLPLLKLRPRKDLVETLLHEMIHAYLFVTDNNKDHDGHGPEFHKHMYRINKAAGTKISVYHNFHDEVDVYKQHWWRCDGPCKSRKPYFGYVKRSMNRAPSKHDIWWAEHEQTCGGKYTKIKEPEDYRKKTNRKETIKKDENKKENSGMKNKDIRLFGGKGKILGSHEGSIQVPGIRNSTKNGNEYDKQHTEPQVIDLEESNKNMKLKIVNKKSYSDDKIPLPGVRTPEKMCASNKPVSQGGNAVFNDKKIHSFHWSDFSDSDDDVLLSIPLDETLISQSPVKTSTQKYVDTFSDHISNNLCDDYSGGEIKSRNLSQKTETLLPCHDIVDSSSQDVQAMLRKVWGQKAGNLGTPNLKSGVLEPSKKRINDHLQKQIKKKHKTDDMATSLTSRQKMVDNGMNKSCDRIPSATNATSVISPCIKDMHTLGGSLKDTATVPASQKEGVNYPIAQLFDKMRTKIVSPANDKSALVLTNNYNLVKNEQSKISTKFGSSYTAINVDNTPNMDLVGNGLEHSFCPVCNKSVLSCTINDHLDLCLTLKSL